MLRNIVLHDIPGPGQLQLFRDSTLDLNSIMMKVCYRRYRNSNYTNRKCLLHGNV